MSSEKNGYRGIGMTWPLVRPTLRRLRKEGLSRGDREGDTSEV